MSDSFYKDFIFLQSSLDQFLKLAAVYIKTKCIE